MLRTVFMGTPDFAVPSLKALIKGADVAVVITQPDRPKGRGKKPAIPPVKETALQHGITVLQPERIREKSFFAELEALKPDIIVAAAYGQILPESILKLPEYGCINVHGSLLPKYRGASPIQSAVANGDLETGVTIMRMDKGLDTGDIILAKSFGIHPEDTGGTVFEKTAVLGAELLMEAMALIEAGKATYTPQNVGEATHCGVITKEMGRVDWNDSADGIINKIRAYNPWPGCYSAHSGGEIIKFWKAEPYDWVDTDSDPGVVSDIIPGRGFVVGTGSGALLVTEVQAGSGKRMKTADYLRGHKIEIGSRFL